MAGCAVSVNLKWGVKFGLQKIEVLLSNCTAVAKSYIGLTSILFVIMKIEVVEGVLKVPKVFMTVSKEESSKRTSSK